MTYVKMLGARPWMLDEFRDQVSGNAFRLSPQNRIKEQRSMEK